MLRKTLVAGVAVAAAFTLGACSSSESDTAATTTAKATTTTAAAIETPAVPTAAELNAMLVKGLDPATPVAEKVTISGAVGHQDVDYDGDYTTWNLGVGYALNDAVGLDLRYYDTDEHRFGDLYESRVVLGLKAAF